MLAITVDDVIRSLPYTHPPDRGASRLSAPPYSGPATDERERVGLAVESMKNHMTDEGWQLFSGLEMGGGYTLAGKDLATYGGHEGSHTRSGLTDVREILEWTNPVTVLVQDKREWEGLTADRSRDPSMRFRNIELLRDRTDLWKGTVLKDAQNDPPYHRASAEEIGAHFWVVYYHPRIVAHLAPFVRPEHLIRTYHSLDPVVVPSYSPLAPSGRGRRPVVLSGALGRAYPLRSRLANAAGSYPWLTVLRHPGYHRLGSATPDYLRTLAGFKVAVCTASIYGYALRKIIEATAAGCRVLTDLPVDDVLPEIDENLTRISPALSANAVAAIALDLADTYDPKGQERYADKAVEYYDFVRSGERLARDIEALRGGYACR